MLTWDRKFMGMAMMLSVWSKDPKRGVGCVVVDNDHNLISTGYNGFPRGIADDNRLLDVETKLKIVVHAEANAIAAAARSGHSLKKAIVYITRPPCAQCAALLIQCGVSEVVYVPGGAPSKWSQDWELAKMILFEAHVLYRVYTNGT